MQLINRRGRTQYAFGSHVLPHCSRSISNILTNTNTIAIHAITLCHYHSTYHYTAFTTLATTPHLVIKLKEQ